MAKKIMTVDDEPTLLELVTAILEEEGFEVITASSGKECLKKLKKIKPDLILLDMMMPELSGEETLSKIRENPKTKDLKVIFVTVSRISDNVHDAEKIEDVVDYITKPFDNKDLIKRVKKALK